MTPGEKPPRHQHEVFKAQNAAHLDTAFRRFLYRPDRLAERYVKYGDRVLDFGWASSPANSPGGGGRSGRSGLPTCRRKCSISSGKNLTARS